MSHEERRTARGARPLSLLILAALALLVASCGGGQRDSDNSTSGTPANAISPNAESQPQAVALS